MFRPILQEDCDPTDPPQFAAWALQMIPRPIGEPVQIAPQFTPFFSQLLWDLGFRHHPELQTKRQAENGYTFEDIEEEENDSTG